MHVMGRWRSSNCRHPHEPASPKWLLWDPWLIHDRTKLQAARRMGLQEATVRENLSSLERLLPDLQPNLDRMRATEW